MTVPSTTRKAGPFSGNGSQTSFPFAFKVFAPGDVKVTLTDALGVETTATLAVDYSVSINSNQDTSPGGTITYPLAGDALTAEALLTVTGDTDYDQALDIPTGGNFNAVALENQLDRATFQIQQLREILSRAVLAPVSSSASGQLPQPEASAIIGWDANETALQNYPLATLATGIAYSAQYVEQFTGNGVATSFLLNNDPVVTANTLVVVDGLIVSPGTDYTLTSSAIIFAVAPAPLAEILVRYGQAVITGGASVDSLDVSHVPATGPVTNVRAALRAQVNSTASLSANKAQVGANSDITSLSGLTTALSIAQGGTGSTTASAAFAAIKQAASTTATGVVELATDTEAQTGTDATRAVTPDNLGAVVLGMGQTYQNLLASRALGTSYTNSSGRTIFASVWATVNTAQSLTLEIGGITLAVESAASAENKSFQFPVPHNTTYRVSTSGGTLVGWAELRA